MLEESLVAIGRSFEEARILGFKMMNSEEVSGEAEESRRHVLSAETKPMGA